MKICKHICGSSYRIEIQNPNKILSTRLSYSKLKANELKTYYWFCLFSLLLIGATLDSPIAFCEEPAFQIQASSYHSDHLNDASDEFPNDYESFVIPIENSKYISVSPLITCTSLENDTWQPQYHPCKLAQTILVDDDWSDKNASFTYIFEDWTDFDWNDVIVDLHASKLNGICSYLYLSFREAAWKNPFSLEITAEGTWIELKWSSTDYPNITSIIIGQGETIEINLFSESNPGDTASVEFLVPPVALF